MTFSHADDLKYATSEELMRIYRWLNGRLKDAEDNHAHAQRTGDWSMREYYSGKIDEIRCQLSDVEWQFRGRTGAETD